MRDAAHRDHPRDRRRDRRLQHPVRGQPRRRAHGRHRDEPARVALLGAGVQGHRLPDRQDRRQARRRATRSTRCATTSRARRRRRFEPTIDYVRGEDPALRLREVPRGRPDADHADEVGRRGDGDRPHLQGGAAEGAALAGERPQRPRALDGAGPPTSTTLREQLRVPNAGPALRDRRGAAARHHASSEIAELTRIDPWFLDQIAADRRRARRRSPATVASTPPTTLLRGQAHGFSDAQHRRAAGPHRERGPRTRRQARSASRAVYKRVDTCAAEFVAHTPYLYSTYEEEDEAPPDRPAKVMILGRGPNRIGQGIEFDYAACTPPSRCARRAFETIMVNCNPETVSTDYDTSDRLYFEPLTLEDVLNIVRAREARGRDRPVRRPDAAEPRGAAGAGGRADPGHLAGRDRPGGGPRAVRRSCSRSSGSTQPAQRHRARRRGGGRGSPAASAIPVLVRPSYVLGGRAMEIVYDETRLREYMREAARVEPGAAGLLIDRFLEDAIEVDVDAVCDGKRRRDRRRHGAHRGGRHPLRRLRLRAAAATRCRRDLVERDPGADTRAGARAGRERPDEHPVRDQGRATVYVLEVNPRASRTVPFVSQGDRRAAREARGAGDGGQDARAELGVTPRSVDAAAHRRQGGGLPVHQVPRRGHRSSGRR